MRTDVPVFIREELRSFHDTVPPLSAEWAKKALDREMKELARNTNEVFEMVDWKPIAIRLRCSGASSQAVHGRGGSSKATATTDA